MTETKEELIARHDEVVKEIARQKKLMERCKLYSSRSKKARWIGSLEFNRLTIEGKMAEFGLTGKNKLDILRDVIAISSGTLAGLFGTNRYDEIDAKREAWVKWIDAHDDNKRWDRWQDCWEEYKQTV